MQMSSCSTGTPYRAEHKLRPIPSVETLNKTTFNDFTDVMIPDVNVLGGPWLSNFLAARGYSQCMQLN